MRIDRLVLLGVVLVLVDSQWPAWAQPRPIERGARSRSRSMFGDRAIGWPIRPVPRNYGGEGTFGTRSNFGRGFAAPPTLNIWSDLPDLPGPSSQLLDTGNLRPASQLAPAQGPATLPLEAIAGLQEGLETQPAQGGWPSEAASDQVLGSAGSSDESGSELGESPSAAGEGSVAPGSPTRTVNSTAPPSPTFEWDAGSLRRLPLEAVVTMRLQKALSGRLRSPLEVTIQGGTATLRGVVATERDRLLAGHLARFEPGIEKVDNDLTVAGSTRDKAAE